VVDEAQDDNTRSWREERSRNAAHQGAELERQRERESTQARAVIAEFVEEALARQIPTSRFVARSYGGGNTYRTPVHGWYLRKNQSVGVGADGQFYVLSVQGSVLARLRGVEIAPSAPPLILGKGARDGESLDLSEALRRVLHPEAAQG
jgi:hypothetical protein